jgi:AraC family ethanolamine operon transcriptional activator
MIDRPMNAAAFPRRSVPPTRRPQLRLAADVDAMSALQPDWALQYDQLARGSFFGSVQQARLPQLHLAAETLSKAARQRGRTQPGAIGFALGLSACGPSFFHGQRLGSGFLMIGRGDELDLTTPDDFQLIGMLVEEPLLADIWPRLYQLARPAWLGQRLVLPLPREAASLLRARHLGVLEGAVPDTDGRAAACLRDAILLEWLRVLPTHAEVPDLSAIDARRRLVGRACDFVLAAGDEPPTMLAVCRAVGASPRKLEYCFRSVLGTSPSRYLRTMRLNAVRRELRLCGDPARTIQDIAARWGFWHMSAFAAAYRGQFGELPSRTRQQALAA